MNSTVFIAGAGGAIGRQLCRLLVDGNYSVIGTTRSQAKVPMLRDLGVEPVVVDVYREDAPLMLDDPAYGETARAVSSLERQVLAAPLEGIILRYGQLYGPGTGFDQPPSGSPLHVDDAADAARRALTRGEAGIYNIAEDDGTVTIEKAAEMLGWVPGFRLDEQER